MLRLTGGFLIAAVCVYIGFYLSDRLKKRRDFLLAFINALGVLKTEISFSKNDIAQIFSGLDENKALCGFFRRCAEGIEERGLKKSWERALLCVCDEAALLSCDKTLILQLGSELGRSDSTTQAETVDRARSLIMTRYEEAEEEYLRLSKVYRSCGALAGIFFIIIFI